VLIEDKQEVFTQKALGVFFCFGRHLLVVVVVRIHLLVLLGLCLLLLVLVVEEAARLARVADAAPLAVLRGRRLSNAPPLILLNCLLLVRLLRPFVQVDLAGLVRADHYLLLVVLLREHRAHIAVAAICKLIRGGLLLQRLQHFAGSQELRLLVI